VTCGRIFDSKKFYRICVYFKHRLYCCFWWIRGRLRSFVEIIDKGVTVEQVAKVTKFYRSRSMVVHAYLMYGYPTQTIQETVDSLEMVASIVRREYCKGFGINLP
jgi:hypothetical protein